ncbi:MAG: 50S ribosomal protein L11 methyltransferase [Bacteroidota bacterium]|jgi:ribosomal protein L11 methyltransferase
MEYTQLEIEVSPIDPYRDWLCFSLAEAGFDMFEDTASGVKAYIQTERMDADRVGLLMDECRKMGANLKVVESRIPWQNWNADWEANFQPEWIAGKVRVRAEFHEPDPTAEMEIIIQPRMAFGTGHHPTTSLVMETLLGVNLNDRSVIDMGCGTAILAIQAAKRGAREILAIDNDPNSVDNSIDNAQRNACSELISVVLGDATALLGNTCDVFIANINRNIILTDIATYRACINPGGMLITSGYYEQDLPMIKQAASALNLHYRSHLTRNDWCCAVFQLT